MSDYKNFQKRYKQQAKQKETISALETEIQNKKKSKERLYDMYEEFKRSAKEALLRNDEASFRSIAANMRYVDFDISQTTAMIVNLQYLQLCYERQQKNESYTKTLNKVSAKILKTCKKVDVEGAERNFASAAMQSDYTAKKIEELMKKNDMTVQTGAELVCGAEDKIKKQLMEEIKKENGSFEDALKKIENRFGPKELPVATRPQEPPVQPVTEAPKDVVVEGKAESVNKEDGHPAPNRDPNNAYNNNRGYNNGYNNNGYGNNYSAKGNGYNNGYGGNGYEKKFPGERTQFDDKVPTRPTKLSDYIGQPTAIKKLQDPLSSAKLTKSAFPHTLITGSYGHGKTTLANIIAKEMGCRFIEVNSGIKIKEMINVLKSLQPNDIIFIDEIHKVATDVVESVLYAAIDGGKLNYITSVKGRQEAISKTLPPFTLIGATTATGKLLKPLVSKFVLKCELQDYKPSDIATIVENSFRVYGLQCEKETAYMIAKRSRLIPRQANEYVKGIFDQELSKKARQLGLSEINKDRSSIAKLGIVVTPENAAEYFDKIEVDENGLTYHDRELLTALVVKFKGGPVGQESLANSLNVEPNVISQQYEPYLVKLGFINITNKGRVATTAAYRYLGLDPKKQAAEGENDEKGTPVEGNEQKQEQQTVPQEPVMPVVTEEDKPLTDDDDVIITLDVNVATVRDEKRIGRIMSLLSGQETAKVFSEGLDGLFGGANKSYNSDAKNPCVVMLHGEKDREVYCDSKLERRFVRYIAESGILSDIRSERLELRYYSDANVERKYFPDFVIKLTDGRVAVVEMKNTFALANHLNMSKYEQLKEYCTDNGFLYAEICKTDDHYHSVEEIKAMPVNEAFKTFVENKIASSEAGEFTQVDLEEWKAQAGETFNELDPVILVLNDETLKNADTTGNNILLTKKQI